MSGERCNLCQGYACEEGCFPRCRHAYDGPDSHRVCVRCNGTGLHREVPDDPR